ncbi:uncharacterized protein CcaverHIS019_0404450 [Cutaneotrichosporon cavernicola]|uniref:Zn(2)-C6 fungal-type domain-containing protein n=1 Tax=Cutaneotrichosporon cavernicola TaxID=279322 RepID=A0AA48L458_9TREE|nr:uncharacterized protein CcaverHIS019_0404450 [Cutaneotrichosporon cavernicola]BEI91625.1 hypothetical protein CcaverHIS019_0404450 [Cutaneotrichosporon cavernicola]BEI99401.1 hypothetical protein CcaverHIS631_0404440 [Cutaneotrichosporon cavernicola]
MEPSNKACDTCYRAKLKCVGREAPPCARCVANGTECTFDGRRKSKITQVEERVVALETALEGMRAHMGVMERQIDAMGNKSTEPTPAVHQLATYTPLASAASAPPTHPAIHHLTHHLSQDPSHHSSHHSSNHSSHSSHPPVPGRKRSRPRDSSSSEVDEDPLNDIARGAPLERMLDRRTSSPCIKHMRLTIEPSRADPSSDADDPVVAGLVTPAHGQALLDAFYAHCHTPIPVFDPATDTWDGLRRSPFALTAAIMVGAMFAREPALQARLQAHAEKLAKETLFAGDGVEVVQGLVVLTAWGGGWRTGGHQLRLAMEMGLYRCLPHLVRTDMGAGKGDAALEIERPLVVGARVWLAVCKAEYEMAFNQGRPLLIGEESSVALGRRLLDHPLSTREDSRLVAACELLAGRQRSHLAWSGTPAVSLETAAFEIAADNAFFDAWHADWMAYYDSVGVPKGHFLRDLLHSGKNHSILLVNSRLLSGIGARADVESLAPERRTALLRSVQAASALVRMATGDTAYRDYFLSMNSMTHVAMAFAARLLIRFAGLVPDAVDLRQTGRDIEALAGVLKRGPGGGPLAAQIQDVLRRARRRRVLPPRSRVPSPSLARAEPTPESQTHSEILVDRAEGFDFGDFAFPADLFGGFSDDDATNIFQWLGGNGTDWVSPI